jgi:sortase A
MRLVVAKRSVKGILKWLQRVLVACAVLLLGYCGFFLVDSWIFQRRESGNLERLLHDQRAAGKGQPPTWSGTLPQARPAIGPDGLIGRIEIPRLGLAAIVAEGTDKTTLRRAVGHISGTALPGQPGNAGLAGHRDTFFRALQNVRLNDIVTVTTLQGDYRYGVVSMKVVSPYDVALLNPTANETLTLVTCYPFYFVGAAPNRFVVRAERVTESAGAPRRESP